MLRLALLWHHRQENQTRKRCNTFSLNIRTLLSSESSKLHHSHMITSSQRLSNIPTLILLSLKRSTKTKELGSTWSKEYTTYWSDSRRKDSSSILTFIIAEDAHPHQLLQVQPRFITSNWKNYWKNYLVDYDQILKQVTLRRWFIQNLQFYWGNEHKTHQWCLPRTFRLQCLQSLWGFQQSLQPERKRKLPNHVAYTWYRNDMFQPESGQNCSIYIDSR